MSEVVIVRKRDAKTDPPETDGPVLTDQGLARYGGPRGLPRDSGHGVAWWRLDLGGEQLWPPPSWWYDLRPTANERLGLGISGGSPPPKGFEIVRETEGEGLTVEDLDLICYWVETMSKVISGVNPGLAGPTEAQAALTSAVARLRAALDALNKEGS